MIKQKWSNKKTIFQKYSVFAADFETTYHREFTDAELLAENQVIEDEQLSFDFTPNESSTVFLCGLKCLQSKKYYLSYEKISDLFDNIVQETYATRHKQALCFFHNLKYDGSYIFRWLIKHNYKQTLRVNKYNRIDLQRNEFSLLCSGGKWFNLSIWWRGIKITFLDSLKLLPTKLDKLGQDLLKMEKLQEIPYSEFKIDKNHNYPQKWLDYLKRDVDILYSVLLKFLSSNNFSMSKITIGSIAYSYIKSCIKQNIPKFTIEDYGFWQNWFHGGLTFPSLKYWGKWIYKKGKIKLIDANSMYPSVMCGLLPLGTPKKKINKKWKNYCCFYKIKIKQATIKKENDDIAIIWKPFEYIKQKDGTWKKLLHLTNISPIYQYLQEVSNEVYYVIDNELKLWEKIYDIKYEVLDVWYFETKHYLKPIIEYLYKNKINAKSERNKSKYLFSKLVLNNLYGKTAQQPVRSQSFYGEEESIPLDRFFVKNKKRGIYGGFELVERKDIHKKAAPVFLGAYITSAARVRLIEKYLEVKNKGGIYLYSDTDSIAFCDTNFGIKLDDLDDIELCKWSYDIKDADAFCSLCPKQYRIVKNGVVLKSASAGIKKEQIDAVPNCDYNYDCASKYKLFKTILKDSELGKVIRNSPFNFLKWKNIRKNPILPKELKK